MRREITSLVGICARLNTVRPPFDLDLIFAPDGIERFEDAWDRRVEVEGFPVCHIDDIISSKEAAGRERDRESLPRLRAFRDYWMQKAKRTEF